jgi:hypothetical protein
MVLKIHFITNLSSYKFCAKSSFRTFIQKLNKVCAMVNMNDIFYTFNILNVQTDETLFLNDIHECSCLIHKNRIVYPKLHYNNCMDLVKM